MNNSLFQLVSIQFKSFYREPAAVFWAVIFPILMAWVLGIAFSSSKELHAVVYVLGKDSEAAPVWLKGEQKINERKMGEDILNPLTVKFIFSDSTTAMAALRKGETSLIVKEEKDRLVFNYDPKNPEAVSTYLMVERELNKGRQPELRAATAPITTEGNRYIDFLIPGLIALGIMNSCLWGISWTLIEFRMKKLLRRMVATPMKKWEFMLAHLISRVALGVFETLMLLLFAWLYFHITIKGSLAGFMLLFLSGVLCFSGIALLIAARTASSQVGNGLINAISLPMMILSGIFFNYHNFPEWSQEFIRFLPLTMLADTIRAIFVEGFTFAQVLLPAAGLSLAGIVFFMVGMRVYKWY